MSNKSAFFIGIIAVSLFIITSIIGGFLIENYSVMHQFISESYAIDTEYGLFLRGFGYIPSGILLTAFSFIAFKKLPQSKLTKTGFYGLGIFYGVATIITGIFPCDSGCNKLNIDPSISQEIHNLTGLLTYLLVPISIILIGFGLRKSSTYNQLSKQGIVYGVISVLFVFILSSNPNSEYLGLYQRVIETVFILWIIACAFVLKNRK